MKAEERMRRREFEKLAAANFIDRIVAAIDPIAGAKRMQARSAMGALGVYSAARQTRRTENWLVTDGDAVADLSYDLPVLRSRARALVRDFPYAVKAVSVLENHVVGTGIVGTLSDATAQARWVKWQSRCDFDGRTDFYGLQRLALRGRTINGEVLAVLRVVQPVDADDVPLRIQLLEADFLDHEKNQQEITEGPNKGGRIHNGVEVDATGRRVAYWMFDRHPGGTITKGKSKRFPTTDILHFFKTLRCGQLRGVTDFAPVLLKIKDLEDYNAAELLSKKLQACMMAFVTRGNAENAIFPTETQNDGITRHEQLQPGSIAYMNMGEDVKFSTPPISQGYRDYTNTVLHAIAAGLQIPYALLTGDLTQVNYSSIRAGWLDFYTMVEADRWHNVIPGFCEPIFQRWVQLAMVDGEVTAAWAPPKRPSVDPVKDATADILEVRAGFKDLPTTIAERGYNPNEVLAAVASTNALLDANNIVLDTDPRKQSKAGAFQPINKQE